MAKNIYTKLFDLQHELGSISKDARNPFYKSKYFDINSLIKQLQPLFKKHKLLLLQPIEEDMVYSKLICIDSAQGVISALKLPEINDPQKLGSAITYYRRYTLASLLGLQAVDDDANIASGLTNVNKAPVSNGAIKDEDKPWLNKDTPEYNKAIAHIKGGGKMEAIEAKFKMSKAIRSELSGL